MAETIFHQSTQFWFPGVSSGNVFAEAGVAIMVYFCMWHLFELSGLWECTTGWEQLARTAGLVSYPSEAVEWGLQFLEFLGQTYRWLGLKTVFRNRWSYELASLSLQDSSLGLRACTSSIFGTLIRPECALSPLVRRPLILLCRQWELWSVISVQVPLYIRLLDWLCSVLCALVSFPGRQAQGFILWWAEVYIRFLAWA